MKLPIPIKLILALFALVIALCVTGLTNGCAWFNSKTPVDIAGTGEGITVPTVNAAMTFWATWVNAGKANQSQVDSVKVAYNQYYQSQLVASNAFQSYFNAGGTNQAAAQATLATLLATATASQTNIIWLIQSFTTTNK